MKILKIIFLIWKTRASQHRRVIIIDEHTEWLGEVEL